MPCVAGGLFVAASLWAFQDAAVEALHRWAGDNQGERETVVIDGREVEYTGTQHRLLLRLAYRRTLENAGWLGYGLREPPLDPDTDEIFRSIDDHYLMFQLRHGLLGVGCFVALALVALMRLWRAAWSRAEANAVFAAAMFGALAGVTLMLNSVWLSPDLGPAWVFSVGLAVTLDQVRVRTSAATPDQAPSSADHTSRRRLVPGHPIYS